MGRWDEALEVTGHALGLLPPAGPRVRLLRVTGLIALARGDFPAAADALRDARAESPVSGESFGTFETLIAGRRTTARRDYLARQASAS